MNRKIEKTWTEKLTGRPTDREDDWHTEKTTAGHIDRHRDRQLYRHRTTDTDRCHGIYYG